MDFHTPKHLLIMFRNEECAWLNLLGLMGATPTPSPTSTPTPAPTFGQSASNTYTYLIEKKPFICYNESSYNNLDP